MDLNELKEFWTLEEKKSFHGWDFSYINDRKSQEPLPWDYDSIVRSYLKTSSILLDMGTGGGEYLLTLKHPFRNTFATEAYQPNYELCIKTISPLGIDVRQVFDDCELPFGNNKFDIIINRHEAFDINEIYRLLKPNGIFITQQVGGLNNKELSKFMISDFKEVINTEHSLKNNVVILQNRGFKMLQTDEAFPVQRFFDVGAFVYFAKIIEWEFPNFSVDKCFNQLCKLQLDIEREGFIESIGHRFKIVAQKPNLD